MTKLLYITNQICGSGGLERVLSIKASYLADELEYEVHIFTLNQGDQPLFYDFSQKIHYHDCDAVGNPVQYFKKYRKGLKSTISKVKPDVIAVCDDGFKGFFVPKVVGKSCPMIYERHASKNLFKNKEGTSFLQKIKFKLLDWALHFGAASYDKFVVLTNDNLNEWRLKNLKVIPNPLSFYPEHVSDHTVKTVITVANHGYQKGIDRLVQAWEIVQKQHPDWKLKVYGKKDKNLQHQKLAEEFGIHQAIEFHDPVRNIEQKYKESSIYAMPSRSEGFGMVLIEAMACGVPCVSFNCPCGPKDIINDNEDGFLVKDGNIQAFAKRISFLMVNEKDRRMMGEKAREKAKRYLPMHVVPMWHTLFTSLIHKNR